MKTTRLITTAALLLASLAAQAETWYRMATENQAPVKVLQDGIVRYRAGDSSAFADKFYKAGQMLECNNATFGDPVVGSGKECVSTNPLLLTAPKVADYQCMPTSLKASNFVVTLHPADGFWTAPPAAAYGISSWWCASKYGYTAQKGIWFRDELPGASLVYDLLNFKTMTDADQRAKLNAFTTCSVVGEEFSGNCDRYKPLRAEAIAQVQANAPTVWPVWIVAKNGTTPSRPVYMTAAGIRKTAAVASTRVAVGATCGCTTYAIEEGASSYCSVSGLENQATTATDQIQAGAVALCVRK